MAVVQWPSAAPAAPVLPDYVLAQQMPDAATVEDKLLIVAVDENGGTLYQAQAGAWVKIAAGVLETGGRELAYAENVAGQVLAGVAAIDIAGAQIAVVAGVRPIYLEATALFTAAKGTAAAATVFGCSLTIWDQTDAIIAQANYQDTLEAATVGQSVIAKKRVLLPPGTAKTYRVRCAAFTNPAGSTLTAFASPVIPISISAREA